MLLGFWDFVRDRGLWEIEQRLSSVGKDSTLLFANCKLMLSMHKQSFCKLALRKTVFISCCAVKPCIK